MTAKISVVSPAIAQLRGDFVALLAQVNDEELLREMLRLCIDTLQEVDMLEDLPPEIIAELEAAAQDDDVVDTVTNEEAFKQFRAWARQ